MSSVTPVSAASSSARTSRVPIVRYLELTPSPHLVAAECAACGARFFDEREACARCSGRDFASAVVSERGEVSTFSIVHVAPEGVRVPFVPAVVDCDGTLVSGNIIDVPPDADHVFLGMRVRLQIFSIGFDVNGVEAVGFGFAPDTGGDAE